MEEMNVKSSLFGEGSLTPEGLLLLLEEKRYYEIKREIADLPPPDIAELFSEVDEKHHTLLFRLLSKELAAETFVEMNSDMQEGLPISPIASFRKFSTSFTSTIRLTS